jgi:hypothetical protein
MGPTGGSTDSMRPFRTTTVRGSMDPVTTSATTCV